MLWQMKFENCGNRMRLETERHVRAPPSPAHPDAEEDLRWSPVLWKHRLTERRGWWGRSRGAQGDSAASPSRRGLSWAIHLSKGSRLEVAAGCPV